MTRRDYWYLLDEPDYRMGVRQRAAELGSDGCTGVPDWYVIACLDHDIAYRTHATIGREPLTRAEADQRLQWAIQHESPLGRFSPMAQWRRWGVRLFGGSAWDTYGGTR